MANSDRQAHPRDGMHMQMHRQETDGYARTPAFVIITIEKGDDSKTMHKYAADGIDDRRHK